MVKPTVVFHGYDASPFATKVKQMLAVKRIPYKRVDVAMTLPRPEITDLLGVKYRRIPILAIGNDVYCDSSLIASVLERRFPTSEGYGTLFPRRKGSDKADTGLVKAFSTYYTDKIIFSLAAQSLPYGKFDAKFLADRAAWQGSEVNIKGLEATQSRRTSTLASHLDLLEEQLADGREWVLDTEQPSLADISAYFVLSWVKIFKPVREIYDVKSIPKTIAWLAHMSDYLAQAQKNVAVSEKISGEDAARLICSSSHMDSEKVLGFNTTEAARLGLKQGEAVSVMPTDNAKIPTIGRLIALTRQETVIETRGSAGTIRCHFPRLEFVVKSESTAAAKL